MPLASFSRQFGEIRPLGPAAREREQPHLRPLNGWWLWYRGWLGRAFAKTSGSLKILLYPARVIGCASTGQPSAGGRHGSIFW